LERKEELDAALNILRTLQLRVSLYNIVLQNPLSRQNRVCGGWGSGRVAGLRLILRNPPLDFVYFVESLECVFGYIAFSLAYKVTEVGKALSGEMEGVASRVVFLPSPARECLKRILEKTPKLAMSISGFHTVERETVPIFVDFVVQQIVGLLVTF
jgi:hypothetical protein